MLKIAGHTMGTPEYTVSEAIELMADMGLDGIEIVVQDGYRSGIPCSCREEDLAEIRDLAQEKNIEIACLTPYNSYFNSLDEKQRRQEIQEIQKVTDACEFLGAKYIRIYGGNLVEGDTERYWDKWEALVDSLREMGNYAAKKQVTLVVENHFNTMAVSARESAALMREVDHPAVRILYDQANLTFTGREDYMSALDLQQDYVAYMHVKDLVFKEGVPFKSAEVSHPKESERNVVTKIVGEGVVPWPEIMKRMKENGYNGWLSLEYERRWHPDDIPDAGIGMKQSAEYLRTIL